MIVWPLVQAALIAGLPDVLDDRGIVYDGAPDSSDETPWYVTVGYVQDADGAGDFALPRHGSGFLTAENGSVHCEVVAKNGDGDLASARTDALAVVGAWQAWVLADQELAGALPAGTSLELDVQVVPQQSRALAEQRLIVSCNYTALTL